ncbi:Multidrug resistance protein [Rhodotorula toruloides]|uniref:ATP-binding cassette, subfamily G (WHITE), member 2, PDR n=1 Tax=Rhodotorula toruloides (strain NP11) TaxID=1130832 RepID=M7XC53_RHOT1|nr:ATP-binding cassette, subfamily G (WHITE), member 2, PDR [Rhodotorula toruloides NP11]EMS21344.1 ATP-binding cassette, subfamily G (WHITE), member 2, PDR [Rhodotorula toruloides NP11]
MSLVGNFTTNTDREDHRHQSRGKRTGEQDQTSLSSSNDDQATLDEQRRISMDVTGLARTMSRRSQPGDVGGVEGDPLRPQEGSVFDPWSDNFKPDRWARAVYDLSANDPHAGPRRTGGIAFEDLGTYGYAAGTEYQATVGNMPLKAIGWLKGLLGAGKGRKVKILQNVDGVLENGETLVVLGPPGSGCSTFLKTLANETHGFFVDEGSKINYKGITPKQMRKNFGGEAIYSAETEQHFPMLTVGQTLEFAAQARAPRHPPGGLSQRDWAKQLAAVVMAIFGISDTKDVKVGNDYIRGVSGGQRKRVSIAEVALAGAPLALWDNSTRGLDSATAVSFCQTIKASAELTGGVACVAIYQAPQPAYECFSRAIVLYEGRSIYFGPASKAKDFWVARGFECPEQQTDPDFLTGLTSPAERRVRKGWENQVPRTPEEFERIWKDSDEYRALKAELGQYDQRYPTHGEELETFKASRRAQQAKSVRAGSPYTLSYGQQIALCLRRGFQRLAADPSLTFFQLFGNSVMALIVSSVFFNLQPVTTSFYSRGSLLFFSVLLNAFGSALEILTLYAQRPIVDKQARYRMIHPSAEAFASMATDMPYKILNAILFNIIIYFMSNLRREPGHFFFFLLISFFTTLVMSMFFRSIAALSRSLSQALVPAALLILALVLYTGFAIPTRYMLGWISWIRWLNPIQYSFEALMVNEFNGRDFTCNQVIPSGPGYPSLASGNAVCGVAGSTPGSSVVDGTTYLNQTYSYYASHKWRNFGVLFPFLFGLMGIYLAASEWISESKSKGEVKVYPRTRVPKHDKVGNDVEAGASTPQDSRNEDPAKDVNIQRQTAIFHWDDLCYDIPVKGGTRRLLDHVEGWVKPGTLTALMGVSGAGKTTLLDVLASRVRMGVVTGDILVDGMPRTESFQRKTGYVQQQDLHLSTASVREALQFSAILRQPASTPRAEKLAYVEEVLKLLQMDKYADAIVGELGEGLNVEERKRLSIAVEMVAKPELLLFLDEPSSGLDSQTAWSVLDLLETLKQAGQAVLCTIHQPSAQLFDRFDRLLFLARGGKTVYFGEVGEQSRILRSYFERNGSPQFPPGVNPAEYMLEVIGAAPGSHTEIDWHQTWLDSPERAEVKKELAYLKANPKPAEAKDDKWASTEFAVPLTTQFVEVQKRVFQQYWRSPVYIYSKTVLCTLVPLFISFSFFRAGTSIQGLQNQLFAVFLLFTVFYIMPQFVKQRESYEVRERPSRTYSWIVFMLTNILIELVWNTLMAVIMYFCLYYPVGFYNNAEPGKLHERGALFFLLVLAFMLFTSTFAHWMISFNETAENGGNIANLLFSLSLVFCGVLATPDVFPGFYIWVYYASPFRYLAEALLATGVGGTRVQCATSELLSFPPPGGSTCGDYMATYIQAAGGYLVDPSSTSHCQFCSISDTNTFLKTFNYDYDHRWRDFGIMWIYIAFNVAAAILCYWLARMPKNPRKSRAGKKSKKADEKDVLSHGDANGASEKQVSTNTN